MGLLLSGVLVWQASNAAFVGVTSNANNSWSAGTVNLTNDSGGTPMFHVTQMVPGQSGSRCIEITSASSVPVDVKFYTDVTALPVDDIRPYIDITVEDGTGGTFASCAGFTPSGGTEFTGTLQNLTTTRTTYANGLGPWALDGTPPDKLSFRISWQFHADAPPVAQAGSTPNVAFIWEAQS
ncbi:hypothetical protein HTZ77_11215 [Nonomuraea sp. SMC257]|uniref:Uncharacterized protein n=1 Tax=Nonomuraea montanisoli TaxID=2741721 RepID=A0A7Y6I5L3_9ACTN|nr:hypothetical protein [Nonomuraea montanisoli]NUW31994.1 hypothetical protein [Nonomuraea montanisoli]